MSSGPVVVVGAGPAGMTAAVEIARAGGRCLLLDEGAQPGGQIYRAAPPTFRRTAAASSGKDVSRADALRRELAEHADRIDVRLGSSVLSVTTDLEVTWVQDEACETLRARRLILATGAYERPVPFPGWTLPGVMTAGGAQIFAKTYGIRPGQRALVAGTGPLLLVVANQLLQAGVEVAAVLEAGQIPFSSTAMTRFWGQWDLIRDAWNYWQGLRRARVPYLFHHTVFEARGQETVEQVVYGPVDPDDWSPRFDRSRTEDVDLLVAGFGFVPNCELATLAGCRLTHNLLVGGWVPVRDPEMATTVPGVYTVGDGAGVAGVLVAVEEGRIAGLMAAAGEGWITAEEARRRCQPSHQRLDGLTRVREVLDAVSRPRPGLRKLATPDTVVCRCEEVRLRDIVAAVDAGARDLQALKLFTRLGMGACQGRSCDPPAAFELTHRLEESPEAVGRIQPRPPIRPVTLGALARVHRAEGDRARAPDHPRPPAGEADR